MNAPLLSIDYRAALDKLAWSQLQGSWELPAELARMAIAAGARSVALEITAGRLALAAPGARLEQRTVSDFASLLDRGLAAAERHRALVDLEEQGAFVLSAIACSEVRSVVLRTAASEGLKLELTAAGELGVVHPGAAVPERPDLRLELTGLAIDARKAARWLARAGRFAPLPISVNGRPIDRGFRSPLITRRLEVDGVRRHAVRGDGDSRPGVAGAGLPIPLPATLAIPRRGGAPRLWLLRHGIIATRATVPGYPAFEAAVEMAPVAAPGRDATGAALRERLGAYVEALLDAAVGLLIRLGGDPGNLDGEARARTGRLLLEAARRRLRLAEVSGVKIFPVVGAAGRRWVSIDEIGRSVRVEAGGVCALDAIPPGEDPKGFVIGERGALELAAGERALLGEHLQVVLSAPPGRLRPSIGRRLRSLVAAGSPALRLVRRRAVPEAELSAAERAFLERLRGVAAPGGEAPVLAFHRGSGRVLRTRDGVSLPRSSPEVRSSVRAVARDPAWFYPAMACLLERTGFAGPDLAAEARRQWLAGVGGAR